MPDPTPDQARRLVETARANTERHAPELLTPPGATTAEHPRDVARRWVETERFNYGNGEVVGTITVSGPHDRCIGNPEVVFAVPVARMKDRADGLVDILAAIIAADREGRA